MTIPNIFPYQNFEAYQRQTKRTVQKYLTKKERHFQNTIGLIGEVTEVVELLLDEELDKVHVLEELADVSWYMSRLLDDWELDMNKVLEEDWTLDFGKEFWFEEYKLRFVDGDERTLKRYAQRLVSISGNISEHLKKHFFQRHDLEIEELAKLCKLLMEEISKVAFFIGCTMEKVLQTSIEKSNRRYPNGWDENNSINRL